MANRSATGSSGNGCRSASLGAGGATHREEGPMSYGPSEVKRYLKRRKWTKPYHPRGPQAKTPWARFEMSYVPEPMSGCWLWIGDTTTNRNGTLYGRLRVDGKSERAHRFSYEHFIGPIIQNFTIDHLCRVSLCVNPQHLEAVSQTENLRRGFAPSAINARKTTCLAGHPFSGEKDGHRICHECLRIRARRARQKKTGW